MNRQIALAYAVAGLAVAIAVIAVVGSGVGWSDPAPTVSIASEPVPPELVSAAPAEVMYVDERGSPLIDGPVRRHDDDDRFEHDDDDDRWEHGRRRGEGERDED